jgi:hypothetical protein
MKWWLPALMAACRPPPGQATEPMPAPFSPPPAIAEFSLGCDADDGRWEVRILTDAWSGGAVSHWTLDGSYIEKHTISSVQILLDGSEDTLELNLSIVADWRLASGSNTIFHCADDVNVVVVLNDLEGKRSDCRVLGPETGLFGANDLPTCEVAHTRDF